LNKNEKNKRAQNESVSMKLLLRNPENKELMRRKTKKT
jgi:hypothetical protein